MKSSEIPQDQRINENTKRVELFSYKDSVVRRMSKTHAQKPQKRHTFFITKRKLRILVTSGSGKRQKQSLIGPSAVSNPYRPILCSGDSFNITVAERKPYQ